MLKKILLICASVLFCASVMCVPCGADGEYDFDSQLEGFRRSIPEDILELLPEDLFDTSKETSPLITGEINQATFLSVAAEYLFGDIKGVLADFGAITAIILIASVFHILKKSFASEAVSKTFELVSGMCIVSALFASQYAIAERAVLFMKNVCNIMNAITPLMSAIYISTGNITTAAVSSTGMMLFITVIENIFITFLIPVIRICFCFSLIGCIGSGVDLSGIVKTIKWIFTTVIVFIMTVFSFVMAYQSSLAQSADSLVIKTARFAVGNAVPIVGGSINESLRTVAGSLSLIKKMTGITGIIIIVIMVLPVIVSLLLNRISLSVSGAVASLASCERESKMIGEFKGVCDFTLALVCCSAVFLIFALALFTNSSVALAG